MHGFSMAASAQQSLPEAGHRDRSESSTRMRPSSSVETIPGDAHSTSSQPFGSTTTLRLIPSGRTKTSLPVGQRIGRRIGVSLIDADAQSLRLSAPAPANGP